GVADTGIRLLGWLLSLRNARILWLGVFSCWWQRGRRLLGQDGFGLWLLGDGRRPSVCLALRVFVLCLGLLFGLGRRGGRRARWLGNRLGRVQQLLDHFDGIVLGKL